MSKDVMIVIVAVAAFGWLACLFIAIYYSVDGRISQAGAFGDTFGVVNSIFSAGAVIGAAYAIYTQQKEIAEVAQQQKKAAEAQQIATLAATLNSIVDLRSRLVYQNDKQPKYKQVKFLMDESRYRVALEYFAEQMFLTRDLTGLVESTAWKTNEAALSECSILLAVSERMMKAFEFRKDELRNYVLSNLETWESCVDFKEYEELIPLFNSLKEVLRLEGISCDQELAAVVRKVVFVAGRTIGMYKEGG